MFPIFGIDAIQMQMEFGEGGMDFSGIDTKCVIPSSFGIIPKPGDILDISFGITRKKILNNLFFVTNAHQTNTGFSDYYQCPLKAIPQTNEDIEKQISSYWYYLDNLHKIVRWDTAKVIIKIDERSKTIISDVNTNYDNNSGFFFLQ